MIGRGAIDGREPSQNHLPEVVDFGLVPISPALQDAFKTRQCPIPPAGLTSTASDGRGAEAPVVG